jgi:hypothetical protein
VFQRAPVPFSILYLPGIFIIFVAILEESVVTFFAAMAAGVAGVIAVTPAAMAAVVAGITAVTSTAMAAGVAGITAVTPAAMAAGVAGVTAVTQISVEARRNVSDVTPMRAFSSSVCTCMRWH